jgi:hypothetical protein
MVWSLLYDPARNSLGVMLLRFRAIRSRTSRSWFYLISSRCCDGSPRVPVDAVGKGEAGQLDGAHRAAMPVGAPSRQRDSRTASEIESAAA